MSNRIKISKISNIDTKEYYKIKQYVNYKQKLTLKEALDDHIRNPYSYTFEKVEGKLFFVDMFCNIYEIKALKCVLKLDEIIEIRDQNRYKPGKIQIKQLYDYILSIYMNYDKTKSSNLFDSYSDIKKFIILSKLIETGTTLNFLKQNYSEYLV